MSVRMTLPEGCGGLDLPGGAKYNADRNGQVQVDERHVNDVRAHYGPLGLIDVRSPTSIGTQKTRFCWECNPAGQRLQAWTAACPFCGAPTTTSNGEPT